MSTEEDPELRDLVAKCLESNGVLGKIRAQLRANTFLALDQQDDPKVSFPISNPAVQKFVSTTEGALTASLVREFLSFFNMQFTLSVFEPESCEKVSYTPLSRASLATTLGLKNSDPSEPLLHSLLRDIVKHETAEALSCDNPLVSEKGAVRKDNDDYDEDFQSASTSSPVNERMKDTNNSTNQASVEEELDVDASDLLSSEVSNIDDTVDKSTKNSSLSADYAETLVP